MSTTTDEALALFTAFLRERELKVTSGRLAVLRTLHEADGPLDADEVFLRLKRSQRSVSRATVYNTLELLIEAGLANRHRFAPDRFSYERVHGAQHDVHLVCDLCGTVLGATEPTLTELETLVAGQLGFTMQRATLQIHGRCATCRATGRVA